MCRVTHYPKVLHTPRMPIWKSMEATGGGSYAYGGGGGYMQDSQGFGASPAGDSKKVRAVSKACIKLILMNRVEISRKVVSQDFKHWCH